MSVKFIPWGHLDKFSVIFNSFKKAIEARGKPEELVPGYLETVRFFLSALNEFDVSFRIVSIAREKNALRVSENAYRIALSRINRALRYMDVSIDFSKKMINDWQGREICTRLDEISSEMNWTELGNQLFASIGKLELDLNDYTERIWAEVSKSSRTGSLNFARHFSKLLLDCRESLAELKSEIAEEMASHKADPILTCKKIALSVILGAVMGACLGSGCIACGQALAAGTFAVRFTCAWKSESNNTRTK